MKLLKSKKSKILTGLSTFAVTTAAFAADRTGDVNAAMADASANQTAATAAVITIALIGFGVYALLRFIKS